MGDVKNLSGREGIEKLQELVKKARVCMFCTKVNEMPFETRPMSIQDVDEEGNIWFFSGESSNKNLQIEEDNHVQLVYSNKGDNEFLTVYGIAEIIKDTAKAEELWEPIVKAWFKDGVDDPNLTIIKVKPQDVYYWDTQHGKVTAMVKIAIAAMSNKVMDDGVEGKLKV